MTETICDLQSLKYLLSSSLQKKRWLTPTLDETVRREPLQTLECFPFITKGDNLLTVGFSWVVSKDAQSHAHLELLVTQPPFIHQNMAAQCLIRPPYFPLHVYVCVITALVKYSSHTV